MPDTAAPHKDLAKSFTHKVGPFPVWVYAVLALGVYYWYTHYGPGASASSAATTAATTDTGANTINGQGPSSTYADDSAWAAAAITYLEGIGVSAQEAQVAIDNYLQGQPNTAQQQSWVQLALNGIGPPPVGAPTQSGTSPTPPIVIPPTTKPQPQPPPRRAPQVAVPNVTGQRANAAIATLTAKGFKYKSTTGDRNPKHEYDVSSQSPAGGTKAAKGSTVSLAFKETK